MKEITLIVKFEGTHQAIKAIETGFDDVETFLLISSKIRQAAESALLEASVLGKKGPVRITVEEPAMWVHMRNQLKSIDDGERE